VEDRNFEIIEHIDYELLFQLDDKIRETKAKIKELEEKKARLCDSGENQAKLDEVEEELREQNIKLNNLSKERSAMLGYLG
jgi:uncharacterized membrane protein YgaE (UPF0421/DUF939 family)